MRGKVVFLGTAAGTPTRERNHPGLVITYFGDVLLFDAGENIQVQLMKTDIRYMKIRNIFITHFHGDHYFGLPGLLFTMGLNERQDPLTIYGPRGIDLLERALDLLGCSSLGFKINFRELSDGDRITFGDYYIEAREVIHSVPTLAYAFVEKDRRKISDEKCRLLGLYRHPLLSKLQKGISVNFRGRTITPDDVTDRIIKGTKIVYSGDTRPAEALIELARDADILIHEATYCEDRKEQAIEHQHSTALEAAEVAKAANVKKLILTHFSKRYTTAESHLTEARRVFPESYAAHDLMTLEYG